MADPDDATGRDPDPFSRDLLCAMLATAGFDDSIVDATPVEHASDAVYVLTMESDATQRRVVLKRPQLVDEDRFRREARVLAHVGDHTSIPVPPVLATVEYHDEVPAPYYVMEYVDGADPEAIDRDPDPDERVGMARSCGRYLAAFHELGPLSGFGWVDVDGDELTVVDPTPDWPAALRDGIEPPLDGLDEGRFADLQSELGEHVERELDRLSDAGLADRAPVPTHNDYRPGNLLVDPDTWETRAVLDWGVVVAAPREYELAKCEQFFSGWAPLDAEIRERVRTALYEGYEERYELVRDRAFERRRDLYLLVSRVEAMYWLPYWLENASEAERDRAAAEHRAFVSELME